MLLFFFKPSQRKEMTFQKKPPPLQSNQNLNQDLDNDGLKDWEEILWKTEPNNSDTDGDGTNDGEEIKLGRNPLKPGPRDEFESAALSKLDAATAETTLTQKIGREFLSQYLVLKNRGDLTSEQKDFIINSMLDKLSGPITENQYSKKDIKVLSDNSGKNIKNYINQLGKIFGNFQDIQKGELLIFLEIANNENEENPQKIEELQKNRLVYEKSAKEILDLRTPSNYQNIHLGFINHFIAIAKIIAGMELIYKDSGQSISSLQNYFSETENIVSIFQDFKKQFEKDGVKISADEEGYIFVREYFAEI